MGKFRIGIRSLAALILLGGLAHGTRRGPGRLSSRSSTTSRHSPALRSPLRRRPKSLTCTIELEEGKTLGDGKTATAWVVRDGQGRVLRKFHDTTGAGGVNIFAYYKDGEEVYREMLNTKTKSIDQFRWVGPYGSKWGVDLDGDRKSRSTPGSPSRRKR